MVCLFLFFFPSNYRWTDFEHCVAPQSRLVQQSVILHFSGGLTQLCGDVLGSFRTGAGDHCVAPVVATNLCEGLHGRVTQWRIISPPSVCLLVCFRLPKAIWSILPVIICLFQRLIRACLKAKISLSHPGKAAARNLSTPGTGR